MARIQVVGYNESEGKLREIYDGLISSRGQLAEVHMIQSLRPESIVKHMDLYMEIMFSRSELTRANREMIAVVVSVSNDCEYCQEHHSEALNHYWKNENRIAQLRNDYKELLMNEKEMKLCHYARQLTLDPSSFIATDLTIGLKNAGLSDSAILDATLVIAYFNFVNRMVLGLGVHLEKNAGKGFNY